MEFFWEKKKKPFNSHRSNGSSHLCKLKDCPDHRKLSFTQEPDNEPVQHFNVGNVLLHADPLGNQISEEFVIEPNACGNVGIPLDPAVDIDKPELTCISEEGIADMDLPDNILDAFDYIGDCITSCDKVFRCVSAFFLFIERICSSTNLFNNVFFIQGWTVSYVERIWKQYQCWLMHKQKRKHPWQHDTMKTKEKRITTLIHRSK